MGEVVPLFPTSITLSLTDKEFYHRQWRLLPNQAKLLNQDVTLSGLLFGALIAHYVTDDSEAFMELTRWFVSDEPNLTMADISEKHRGYLITADPTDLQAGYRYLLKLPALEGNV